jgi:hypothetical protein
LIFVTNPQWIEGIGSMHINVANNIEINWVEHFPWQYRDFQMLYNGETANAHPSD